MAGKNRIRELRKARGWTQEVLAQAIGCHPITVSKLENGGIGLDSWIEKLSAAFNIAPQDIIASNAGESVPVIGAVKAGAFSPQQEWPEEDRYSLTVPEFQEWRGIKKLALEVRGPSMNLLYPDGSIVIYAPSLRDPLPRRRFVVIRERDGEYETTLKEFTIDSNGRRWLLPRSDDPSEQTPIEINGNDKDTIRIAGQVIWSFRREDV